MFNFFNINFNKNSKLLLSICQNTIKADANCYSYKNLLRFDWVHFYILFFIGFFWCSSFILSDFFLFFIDFSQYFNFFVDELSLIFIFLSNFLIFICFLLITIEITGLKFPFVFLLLSILWIFLIIIFSTDNLIVFFITFEITIIPIFFLIGIWGSIKRVQAVNYLYFYTAVGAVTLLTSILLVNYLFKTISIIQLTYLYDRINLNWRLKCIIWGGFFLSFSIKAPLVPFHIWLPKAHVEAPTIGSVLLAGIILKIGLYGIIRICIFIFTDVSLWFSPLIMSFCTLGGLYASLVTLRQIDIKRIIAYSSVSHISLAVASIISSTSIGVSSGVYLAISHGVISSSLFILVGSLYARFHNRLVIYYGGLYSFIPKFTFFFFFFSISNIAFPLTSGFISELLCLTAIFHQHVFLGFLAASSIFFSTVYSILLFNRIFLGSLKSYIIFNYLYFLPISYYSIDLNQREIRVLIPCIFFVIFYGIWPIDLLISVNYYLDVITLLQI